MKPFQETTMFRFSLGLLLTIGSGLIMGTAYMVNLSANQNQIHGDVENLKSEQFTIATMQTDIAVIKTKQDEMNEKIDVLLKKRSGR